MSRQAKPQWGLAAKNGRSATRAGLWAGFGRPVTHFGAPRLRTPGPPLSINERGQNRSLGELTQQRSGLFGGDARNDLPRRLPGAGPRG